MGGKERSAAVKEILVKANTLPEAYHKALKGLWKNGTEVDCPAWNTQCLECGMTMVVNNPLGEPRISKYFPGGPYDLERYRQEMLDGIMDFEVEGGNWAYTYHKRMVDYFNDPYFDGNQIEFVIDELRRDKHSRRAVIGVRFNDAEMYSSDPACLQHIQYFIRNGKLDCSVLFRSNDALEATFMNAFALIELQSRIAKELGVEVGTYTHRANSFHVYQKDYARLEGVVKSLKPGKYSNAYFYKGEWDELMEEERPRIAEFVEGLKNDRA